MDETPAPKSYALDKNLFLYTSLTSGSSHIVTATSRLETILKANRIPFIALDIATDDRARMIWGRKAGKDESGRVRKLPGLVQEGKVLGDLVEIEEWNEYGEMKMHVKIVGTSNLVAVRSKPGQPAGKAPVAQENKKPVSTQSAGAPKSPEQSKTPTSNVPSAISSVLQQVGQEAAQIAKSGKKKVLDTLGGVGEPAKKEAEKAPTPAPLAVNDLPIEKLAINDPTSLQSPNSTAWRKAPDAMPNIEPPSSPPPSMHKFSLQSPNSTAWKPTDFNPPILEHRGSSISVASAEEIKQVEEACAIPEEDEDEDEDTSDEEDEGKTEKETKPDIVKDTKPAPKVESESEEDESDESDDDTKDEKP